MHDKYIKIVNYFVASFRYFSIYNARYTIRQTWSPLSLWR